VHGPAPLAALRRDRKGTAHHALAGAITPTTRLHAHQDGTDCT
jgi:hypothetical protein